MKLLITGDWHYRAQPPISRLDDFQATLNAKIREVGEIARRENCHAVIVPGDLTDSPSLAYSTLTTLERLLKEAEINEFTIPGNHDEYAGSLESLSRTAYGHLTGTGWVRDLASSPAATDTVTITGTGFSTNTDNDISDYLPPTCADATKGSVRIHVAHGMLLERKPGFDMKHTLLEDVAKHPDCPDCLIVGHEHLGFGVKRLPRRKGGELVAINVGALARLSAHPGEMERTVQVCLLEVYPGAAPSCHNCEAPLHAEYASPLEDGDEYIVGCRACGGHTTVNYSEWGPPELWGLGSPVIETTLIPLASARPAHEVLSREHLEAQAAREKQMDDFMALLKIGDESRFLDIQAIVESIARMKGIGKDVVDEALTRIAAEREKGARRKVA